MPIPTDSPSLVRFLNSLLSASAIVAVVSTSMLNQIDADFRGFSAQAIFAVIFAV